MPERIIFSSQKLNTDLSHNAAVGGKAARLLELSRSDIAIPRFFVIAAQLFEDFLASVQMRTWLDQELAALDLANTESFRDCALRIQSCLHTHPLAGGIRSILEQAHQQFFPPLTLLAVRSSIVGEDSATHSFAGIHDSVLGVKTFEDLAAAVLRVWCSAFSERALLYRHHRGIGLSKIRPAVIVQELIPAHVSGVMFSRHPIAAYRDQLLIHATWGLGLDLVNGQMEGDRYWIDRDTRQIKKEIAGKSERWVVEIPSDSVTKENVPEEYRETSCLADLQISELTRLAFALEQRFAATQDLEFCVDSSGRVWLLQARDVGSNKADSQDGTPAVGENHCVWDSSNIAESYSGITLPLTFSFIRRVYAIVYHGFAEVMGVSPRVIRAHRRLYENLLGSIDGRVYYNLKSWYRALALLPGFEYNRRFLETMMGVSRSMSGDVQAPKVNWFRRWFVEFPGLIRTLFFSLWNLFRVQRLTDHFLKNFQTHYNEWSRIDFRKMSPCQLQVQFEKLEDALLWNWKAPIIGDFHVMIFYGLLKKFCETWCGGNITPSDLIRGTGDIESTAPARLLLELVRLAIITPGLSGWIGDTSEQDLIDGLAKHAEFHEFSKRFWQYIDLYGFRCPEELKLESPSLKDDPGKLFEILRNYLTLAKAEWFDGIAIGQHDQLARSEAERRALNAIRGSFHWFPRRTIFLWVLRQARKGIRNRENMRFARTRVFGLVREILRSTGQAFASAGQIDSVSDIFYLTIEEVWDFVKGTAVTTDLRALVTVRRREYCQYYSSHVKPASRFETWGVVYQDPSYRNSIDAQSDRPFLRKLTGIGSCGGVATGRLLCLTHPQASEEVRDAILAGERMDAGWVTLFPLARGVLVEYGNILSHAAVVAREMGIPTIVNIRGLTSSLETGMTVRMDGQAGTVEVLST